MLGLGEYASSDDEADEQPKQASPAVADEHVAFTESLAPDQSSIQATAVTRHMSGSSVGQELHTASAPVTAAQQGPVMPEAMRMSDLEPSRLDALTDDDEREMIRNLTMPPYPNMDIPPSPPGSPVAGSNETFAHFLKLKQRGVHFNSKLESSSALRNPALLQKVMQFAQIDEYDQYATALPADLAVPTSYPPWAYGEALAQMQQKLQKKADNEKLKTPRDRLDFVHTAGSSTTSATSRETNK